MLIKLHTLGAVLILALGLSSSGIPGEVELQEGPDTRPAGAEEAEIGRLLERMYAVISGPAGKERDWAGFRALLHPACTLTAVRSPARDRAVVRTLEPEEYIRQAGPFFAENGFFEREIHRRLEIYGNIAHAFSTYVSFSAEDQKEPAARGINSIQLLRTPGGWRVFNILWQQEAGFMPLPKRYLPAAK